MSDHNGLFRAKDMNGGDFWVDFDGAEGIGFWIGDPENSVPLSRDVTDDLITWIHTNWRTAE